MIPAIGGGLCQLSNALYQAALDAGCEIIERHPHSRIVPGSGTWERRDATVAWNYIDLRFCAAMPLQLQVQLTPSHLHVALLTTNQHSHTLAARSPNRRTPLYTLPILSDYACESCGQVSCFRSDHHAFPLKSSPKKAFLLDTAWPEFIRYVKANHTDADEIAMPIDGNRWNRPQYAWPTQGFATIHTATYATLLRSFRSRRLAEQGARRQRAFLDGAKTLATQLAKKLDAQTDEVCVSQSLLPFLWSSGALGGRRISILCTHLPASVLQAELNRGFAQHPESTTLNDFRTEHWLAEAEDEALYYAEQIITPHGQIAALFPDKSRLLEWSIPPHSSPALRTRPSDQRSILFPCATLGRKGAYELREAIRGMNVRLLLGGKLLEDANFWDGFKTESATPAALAETDLVIQPCIVESQPRALLRAIAAGVPVITTLNSGLHPGSPAHFVPSLDAAALHESITARLTEQATQMLSAQTPSH